MTRHARTMFTQRLANRVADVGSTALRWRVATAVRPVTADDVTVTDDDGTDVGAGTPMPGWWVTLDDATFPLPVMPGSATGVEPDKAVWVAVVGDAMVVLGAVSTARNDWPAWSDDPTPSPMHPWIRVALAGDLSTADSTWTEVVWDDAHSDGHFWGSAQRRATADTTFWRASTDPTAADTDLVIPFDGLWAVTYAVEWNSNSTGIRQARVARARDATTTVWAASGGAALTGAATPLTGSTGPIACQQDDVLTLETRQTSGGALDLTGSGYATTMTVHYVGPGPAVARSTDADRLARIDATFNPVF